MSASSFRFRSVRTRMISITMLAFVVVVAILAGTSVVASNAAMRAAIDADLRRRGEDFALVVQRDSGHSPGGPPDGGPPPGGDGPPKDGSPEGGPPRREPPTGGARRGRLSSDWTAPAHITVGQEDHGGDANGTPYDPKGYAEAVQGHEGFTTVEGAGEPHRVFSIPVQKTGRVKDVVQVAAGMRTAMEQLELLRWTLLATVVPLGLLLGGLASLFVVDRLLKPLRHLNDEAIRIGENGFGERLDVRGDDEFASLAHTLNGMVGSLERVYRLERESVERLQEGIERQRRFTGDASHELKTPLAVIKTYLGVLKRSGKTVAEEAEVVGSMDRAADRMNDLIGGLLVLARSDSGIVGDRTLCRLDRLLEEAVESVPATEGRVRLRVPSKTWVEGDASELVRLFANLVENAIKHSESAAPVEVRLTVEDRMAVVDVEDHGVGIAAEHLPHLFERFYRVDRSRTSKTGGSGLGLAICESIAQSHGGEIAVASVVGRGTRFTVRLPLTAAPG